MSGTSDMEEDVSQLHLELYFLIAKFLGAGPCKKTAEVLQEELKRNKLLPRRVDWEGNQHFRSFENLLQIYRHISPNHLLEICKRIGPILDKEIPPNVKGVASLLGAGSQSILRTPESVVAPKWLNSTYSVLSHGMPLKPTLKHRMPNFAVVHSAREIAGVARQDVLFQTQLYSDMALLSRSLGHLSAVYCVSFDRTGKNIITGADDHLVKIWSSSTGRLLSTLRGHAGEVSDMAVNYENTLLATGSCDKTIRVWNLKTTAPVAVLHAHNSMITSLMFCPYNRGDTRYLVSTGGDGCVCFWTWNVSNNIFNPKPFKFIERSRAGAQMLCSSFSPGGIFLATGNADHVVRVYCFNIGVPEKICELEMHTDRVDSIQYSHADSRFLSGSKDGTARIWRYERQQWKAIVLYMAQRLDSNVPLTNEDMKNSKLRVTMVSWTTDDLQVITAVSNYSIKVWDSHTGQLRQVLTGHQNEAFVLETNLNRSNLLLTAGHDGYIFLWDLSSGEVIFKYLNTIQGQGHGAVFDCKWAPDGQSFAATDSHGFLLYFGFGSSNKYKKCPEEQFFHTDYRPLIRDANNYVLDEQTQQPPHLMPPPFIVDMDGNPHAPEFQRLVPGREHFTDQQQLIPQMGVANNGDREVLDGSLADLVAPAPAPVDPEPPPPPQPAAAAQAGGSDEAGGDIIDHMIDRLQREQDERMAAAGQQPLMSPRTRAAAAAAAAGAGPSTRRRSSVTAAAASAEPVPGPSSSTDGAEPRDVSMQQQTAARNISVWHRRVCVYPVRTGSFDKSADFREAMAEAETKDFVFQRKKKPLPLSEVDSSDSGSYIRTRRKKKHHHGYRTRSAQNEETAPNRLITRALYDTDVEEYSTPQSATQEDDEDDDDDEEDSAPRSRRVRGVGVGAAEEARTEDNQSDVDDWKDSSDSESSDYSDWAADGGTSLAPPKRRSQRRTRRRRRWDGSEEEEDEEEKEEKSSDEETEVDEEPEDPTSPEPRRKRPRVMHKNKRESKGKQIKRKAAINHTRNGGSELKEEFRPPEWLTECVPHKAPYHPQIGDELVYFRQGHALYVQAVKNRKVYAIDTKNLPWHKNPQLREQELVKVTGIKYEIKPPRLVCLKLAFIDPETCRMTGGHFTVKYHDMPDVIDFFVLKQTYDTAISRQWKIGDRFRCMIEDSWWSGEIRSQEPLHEEFQDSLFQCFNVLWDNGETEKLSPWDLEPMEPARQPNHRGGSMAVRDEEIQAVLYQPRAGEWPQDGRDAECERLSHGFEQIMELSMAEWFLAPVDLNAFPLYAYCIAYPIDLNLIKTRIDNRFYRRVAAIQYDVRLLESNAVSFNEPESIIVTKAKLLTELCLRFISDPKCTDVMRLYNEVCHDDKSSHQPQQSSYSTRSRGPASPERSLRRVASTPVADPDAWRQKCLDLLDVILEHDDSAPFRCPVDLLLYPDYESIVDTPMDFGTIHEQLEEGNYHNPGEILKDARLVFHNSKTYNTNTRSRIYAMTLRLSAMFEEQMKPILAEYKQAKRQGKQPAHFSPATRRHTRSSPLKRGAAESLSESPPRASSSLLPRRGSRGAPAPVVTRSTERVSPRSRNANWNANANAESSAGASASGSAVSLRRKESRPQRAVAAKRRRLGSDSDEGEPRTSRGVVRNDSDDDETEHEAASSEEEETEVEEEEEEEEVLSGPSTPYRARPRSRMSRLMVLKKSAAGGSSLVNGHSSPSPSPKNKGFKKPSPPTRKSSARYTTRNSTGARRSAYRHRESDESITPPKTRKSQRGAARPAIKSDDDDDASSASHSESELESENSDKENNEESDSGTEEYSADEAEKPKPARAQRQHKRPSRLSEDFLVESNRMKRSTRNRGQPTVNYGEDSEGEEEVTAVTSRGRVRKIPPRARGVRGIVFRD